GHCLVSVAGVSRTAQFAHHAVVKVDKTKRTATVLGDEGLRSGKVGKGRQIRPPHRSLGAGVDDEGGLAGVEPGATAMVCDIQRSRVFCLMSGVEAGGVLQEHEEVDRRVEEMG